MAFDRRVGLRALLLGLAGAALGGAGDVPAGYYTDQKVVYQNDGRPSDEAGYFHMLLANIQNHIDTVGRDHITLRVVNFAQGVDLLVMANSDPSLAGALDRLRAQRVVFLVCRKTLSARKLDWHTLYGVQESDLVPSGVAEIARLEGMGYVFEHP